MEFGVAPEILEAFRKRIDRRIFGYTGVFDNGYYESFKKWCKSHYDWEFPQEELCFSPGIIPALYKLTGLLCSSDNKVLFNTPAYGYFLHAAEQADLQVLLSPLHKDEDGGFSIDYEDFERKCADPHCRLVFWCNPHNLIGRVWKEKELRRVADIVKKYDLWIISDEIHCDRLRIGQMHIPMGKIMCDYPKLITCMAPTKTFNLAGLAFSNIIIRDPQLRETYRRRDMLFGMVNTLSLEAAKAAYDLGDPWLRELRVFLDGSFAYVKEFLREYLPAAVMNISEATYLAWINMADSLPKVQDLPGFFATQAGVLLEGGNGLFVGNADGYIRLNLAMPRSMIRTGMERIRDAIYYF